MLILQVSHFVEKNGGTCVFDLFEGFLYSNGENHKSAPKNRGLGALIL